jgi:hypothetical protein
MRADVPNVLEQRLSALVPGAMSNTSFGYVNSLNSLNCLINYNISFLPLLRADGAFASVKLETIFTTPTRLALSG